MTNIVYFENVGHSPAWPEIPNALAEIEAAGMGFHPRQVPAWSCPCLAWVDDTLKGFLIYQYDEQQCSWFILLAWVKPSARRQGVHTAMFNALVERATVRGDILSITSGTHVNNIAAQASFEAQGRKKAAIMYSYKIREYVEGKPHLDLPST